MPGSKSRIRLAVNCMCDKTDKTKTCKLCHGVITAYDSRGGVECGTCRSLYIEEVPSNETLSEFYKHYNDKYTGGGTSGGRNQIRYARRYLRMVRKHTRGGTLLDMGCANNPFPNLAARMGYQVTAMDYSRPKALDTTVRFQQGHLNSKELMDMDIKFDAITSWAVIEHVADPDLAFKILAGLLEKGGQLHLTTPEYGTALTCATAGRTRWFYPPEHLHLLSPVAMRILAGRHGLLLAEWRHFETNWARWIARYGIGAAEFLAGSAIKAYDPDRWQKAREKQSARFIGIAYYRFVASGTQRDRH